MESKQEIGYDLTFYCEYDGTWWMADIGKLRSGSYPKVCLPDRGEGQGFWPAFNGVMAFDVEEVVTENGKPLSSYQPFERGTI